ncbi:flagellar hook-associated protein FlgK [Halomonas sp. A40-4]|uniref:flagellar hook-associated protein FlgK n=1 Tax=unclassified Halomonas TaxID=2609666 RepID=UPI000A286F69|nr:MULTISPECIES: flagellar hook-associated protein FlgK [unclassified Halomonas]QPL46313.1 flagellar hook-associated protein FlgK [Halomonas sp. A40-4]
MSMFSVGLSGLNAAQNALNTTSNNISNVYTPGYNREITKLGESSAGTSGVQVNDIERQFNQYVAEQLNSAKTQSSALETYYNQVTQIDNLLADRDAGLAPLMQNFFSSLEDLASSPSDPAARQGVLGNAETLSAQFRSFDSYLQDMQTNINSQLKDEVTQINNTTEQVAGLNKEIALARARTGEAPNSLLNQRDKLVSDLNERMDLRLNIQDGKTYNVSLPNGQPLVTGTNSFQLETMEADYDPQRTVIGYRDGGGNLSQLDEDVVTGGSLGGLMNFRQETLDKTQNQIGQLAVSLSSAMNEQHKQGVDLNGEQGENFFNIRAPQTYGYESNSDATITSAEFDASRADELRATDYTVSFDGANPVVTRNDNGQEVEFDQDAWNDDEQLKFGGITIEFSDTPAPVDGDQFEIQPVRRAGAGMEANISDLDKIAAGSFEFEQAGTMAISDLRVTGDNALTNSTGEQLEFDLAGGELTIDGFTGNVLVNGEERALNAGVVQTDATGGTAATFSDGDEITVDGVSFVIDDAGTDSTLTLSQATANTGDNRNALAMQDLQSQNVVGGSATVSGAYGSMVSDVGNRTNITEVNLDARQGLTDQLTAVQQSESGVNLDEEAANLIRYQQFYQANARVIDTAGTIMDTILNLRG